MSAITNNIAGIIIGIVIAVILVIILQKTVFKNSSMKLISVIIIVLFAIAGGVIQSKFFTAHASAWPTPQEQIENITSTIKDSWKNTNGGFTFEQIQLSQSDDECPVYDDLIIDLKCYDFGSYQVFSFEDDGVYQNASFYNSTNGLILDGIINMHAHMTGMKWFFAYNLDTFYWVDDRANVPEYVKTYVPISWEVIAGTYDNLLSVSRQTLECLQYDFARTNKNEAVNFVMTNIANITAQNVSQHFIKFGDAELIGSSETGYSKINTFYNYLYQQVKGQPYNTKKLIDASSCLCVPIPEDIQQNYPISASNKADYDNADYYGVYRCNIAVNLEFLKGNNTINATDKNEKFIEELNDDPDYKDKVQVDQIASTQNLSKLNLSFLDEKNSDLTNLNLLTKPVKITFSCAELNQSKTVIIDSIDRLNSGLSVLLAKDATWDYYIESEALIFDNFRGSFTIKSTENNISFSYYFLDNYTIASVGLNPVGTIDKTLIDLSANPVRIILSNSTQTYQFVFDDNSILDSYKSSLVEMGTYDYTILSDQLIFAQVTGSLTITSTDKTMLFNYALASQQALSFAITLLPSTSTSSYDFTLYSASSNVALIRETLSSAKVYLVNCIIYDDEGKMLENFSHTHSVTGTCSDNWTSTNLVAGETYTLQLRFADRDDTTITYLSDIATFTYQTGYQIKVVYEVTKN